MTANASTLLTPARRVCRWLDADAATSLRCGTYARLYVSVPRATGRPDAATYFVEAVVDQESGQTAAWRMTRMNADGSWGEDYLVTFGAESCGCKSRQFGPTCKHICALRAALRAVGVEA